MMVLYRKPDVPGLPSLFHSSLNCADEVRRTHFGQRCACRTEAIWRHVPDAKHAYLGKLGVFSRDEDHRDEPTSRAHQAEEVQTGSRQVREEP